MDKIKKLLEKWRREIYLDPEDPSYQDGYNDCLYECADELEDLWFLMEADKVLEGKQ